MGERKSVRKFDRASSHVLFFGLSGYISSRELTVTLYNAAIKQGAFKNIYLFNAHNGNIPVGTNVYSNKDLIVVLNSNIDFKDNINLRCQGRWGSSGMENGLYFEAIGDEQNLYTGAIDNLCYSIEWVDRKNVRRIVADVIYPNIVYIRFTDISYGSYAYSGYKHISSFKALSYIIKEAADVLSDTKRAFVSKIITKRKEKLIYLMHKQLEETTHVIKEKIQKNEDTILDYKRKIQDLEINLESDKNQLAAYDALMGNLRDKFLKELGVIKNIGQVTAVDEYSNIDKGIISVDVAGIKIRCQRNWYYLGDYTININIADKTVRFINTSGILRKSHWGDKCHHPHCNSEGRPCLGNISTQIIELIGSLDLAFLVNLCISYLQSVNINDAAGSHIVNWPLCDDNGVIISEKNEFGLIQCHICNAKMPEIENEDWEKCDDCGEWKCPRHTVSIETAQGEVHVCANCFTNYKLCKSCGKYELKDLFKECPVCRDSVCPDCFSDEIKRYMFYKRQRINFICKKHHVHKCEGCGLWLVDDTDTCPSCDLGEFSVGVCAVCGQTTPIDSMRDDYTDICVYCNPDDATRCDICGRYDNDENIMFDVVTGQHRHRHDCTQDAFDIDEMTELDAGAIELQRGHIENEIREYAEVNNITINEDYIDYAIDEVRNRIYQAMGVPQDMLIDENDMTATRIQAILAQMVAEALVGEAENRAFTEDVGRDVADGELTPLPEGIQEFYNQPVVNEETLPFPEGTIYEDPIVDDIITG